MLSRRNLLSLVLIAAAMVGAWLLFRSDTIVPDSDTAPRDVGNGLPFATTTATATYTLEIDVPATDNAVLNASVRRHIDARVREFDEQWGEGSLDPEEREALNLDDDYRYELMLVGYPWEYGTIDGMRIEEYRYTGGAHGGTTFWPFYYDARGRELRLSSFFADTRYIERITAAVRPRLKYDLERDGMYVEELFLAGTEPSEGNYVVFSLSDDGITFRFNEYQVAPYAAGTPRVTVPFSELRDILLPGYF